MKPHFTSLFPSGRSFSLRDLIAGLSIAGLLLPEAVAYANIAHLPPQAGIIALFAGLLCYALVGSSRFAIVSATSSSAAVVAATTYSLAGNDEALRLTLAMGLVLMTALFFILAALLRLGSVTDFIAKPVLKGFAFGLALLIILRQFSDMVGVHPLHRDLFRFLPELFGEFARWNLFGLLIGGSALLFLFLMGRFQRIPSGLLVITVGILLAQGHDLTQYGVPLVGAIDLSLQMPSLPRLSQADWLRLGELGWALALILYSESYGSVRRFAMKHGDSTAPNRDLWALGLANLLSGLFHGQPVGAGYSATSANEAAGATSRLAGLSAALFVLMIVLLFLPMIALTPQPILAAIVIHAVSHTLNPSLFRPYFTWRRDRVVILVAVLGVLALGVLDGLLTAIALSVLMLLKRMAEARVSELGRLGDRHDFVPLSGRSEVHPVSGIAIFRPDQPLFFANVDRVLRLVRQQVQIKGRSVHTVIISLEESPDLDSSTLETLQDFFAFVEKNDKQLILARLKPNTFEVLQATLPKESQRISLSELSVDEAVHLAHRLAACVTPLVDIKNGAEGHRNLHSGDAVKSQSDDQSPPPDHVADDTHR